MGRPILVVDDDEDVRTMLCVVLSAEGYTAAGAADGVEALQRMRSAEPPALVFIDLMMPRMNGEDLIRAMTRDPSLARIPIAIMSGQPAVHRVAQALRVRAGLIKPIELDDVLAVVHEHADQTSWPPAASLDRTGGA